MEKNVKKIISELNKNPNIKDGWFFTEEWTWNQFSNKKYCITFVFEDNELHVQTCTEDGSEVFDGFELFKEDTTSLDVFMKKLEPFFIKYN